MRSVLIGDVVAMARAMHAVPTSERRDLAERIRDEAELADRYRRATGRGHPCFGNGSVMSAAMRRPLSPEKRPDVPSFGNCLVTAIEVLCQLATYREAQETQVGNVGSSSSRLRGMGSPHSAQ